MVENAQKMNVQGGLQRQQHALLLDIVKLWGYGFVVIA